MIWGNSDGHAWLGFEGRGFFCCECHWNVVETVVYLRFMGLMAAFGATSGSDSLDQALPLMSPDDTSSGTS